MSDMHRKKHILYILSLLLLCSSNLYGCGQKTGLSASDTPSFSPTHPLEAQIEYRNPDLGFSLSLPSSWEGFSIRKSEWEGLKSSDLGDVVVERGLLISIVHPKSTAQQPRQDIPIMVFTLEQWDQLQQGEFHIGAAPIGPLELGRNRGYVFALPARYNYAFLEGWEEVEQIVQNHPIVTFEPGVFP
jgi:hypothetical protein